MKDSMDLPPSDDLGRSRQVARRQFRLVRFSALVLVLAGLALGAQREATYRAQRAAAVRVQAEIFAGTVSAALAFDDRQVLLQSLRAFGRDPDVEEAIVFDSRGAPISLRDDPRFHAPPRRASARRVDGHIEVTRPVIENGAQLGWVRLITTREPMLAVIARYSGLGLMTLIAILLLWFAGRMARQLERRA